MLTFLLIILYIVNALNSIYNRYNALKVLQEYRNINKLYNFKLQVNTLNRHLPHVPTKKGSTGQVRTSAAQVQDKGHNAIHSENTRLAAALQS